MPWHRPHTAYLLWSSSSTPVTCKAYTRMNTSEHKIEPESPSLDTRTTSVEVAAGDATAQRFIFKRWSKQRERWIETLSNSPNHQPFAVRMENCGTDAWIQRSPSTKRVRVVCNACRVRTCPRCQHNAAGKLKRRLDIALRSAPRTDFRLITLTMRSTTAPLRTQILNLKASFRRLRQRKSWQDHVQGGYAILEITYNAKRDQWHPHLHVITSGKFFRQAELSREWGRASRGSPIVDIRRIRTTNGVLHYVTAYVTKQPEHLENAPEARWIEYFDAIRSSRFLIAFGNIPRASKPEPDPADPRDWEPLQPLYVVVIAAEQGQEWARLLLKLLRKECYAHDHDSNCDTT